MTQDQKQKAARRIVAALSHQPHPLTVSAEKFVLKYGADAGADFIIDLHELLATALAAGRDQPWGK